MAIRSAIAQLFLRLALGVSFLLPVMDRIGWLGEAGQRDNAWGNWQNFVDYTHMLMPYMNIEMTGIMAMLATIGEAVFGVALIIGYKTRWAALGSFVLLLAFALSMLLFSGYRAPFSYSVFTASAASLLLAAIPAYRWSLDASLAPKRVSKII